MRADAKKRWLDNPNAQSQMAAQTNAKMQAMLASPLLNRPRNMPDSKRVAEASEISMRLAWASVRDIDYRRRATMTQKKWTIHDRLAEVPIPTRLNWTGCLRSFLDSMSSALAH